MAKKKLRQHALVVPRSQAAAQLALRGGAGNGTHGDRRLGRRRSRSATRHFAIRDQAQ